MPFTNPPTLVAAVWDLANAHNTPLPASGTLSLVAGKAYLLAFATHVTGGTDLSTGYTITHDATDRTSEYTFINQAGPVNDQRNIGLYSLKAVRTEDVVITFDPTGGNKGNNAVALMLLPDEVDEDDIIVQSKPGTTEDGATLTITLDSAPTAGNMTLAFFNQRGVSGGATPDADYTELYDIVGSGSASDSGWWEAQYKTDLGVKQTCGISGGGTGSDHCGVMVEIRLAAGGTTTPQAIAATAVGVAVMTTAVIHAVNMSAVAVGVTTIGRSATYFRLMAAVAVAQAVLNKKMFVTMAVIAVGIPEIVKKVYKTLAATSVGVAEMTTAIKFTVSMPAVAIGVATLVALQIIGVTIAAVAVGIAVMVTQFVSGAVSGFKLIRSKHHRRRAG